jgi:hypothetical protein
MSGPTLKSRNSQTTKKRYRFNPLTPELNPSAQSCLTRFLLGILIFKGLTARRIYKSFGFEGLIRLILWMSLILAQYVNNVL